jgi:hypothetical protein
MTEPQRWDEPSRRWQAVDNGAWVRYADAQAWVEREVAAAEQRGIEGAIRKYEIVGTDDRSYEQGQRDEREAASKRVLACPVYYMHGSPIKYVAQEAAFLAVIDSTAPQECPFPAGAKVRHTRTNFPLVVEVMDWNHALGLFRAKESGEWCDPKWYEVIDGTAPQDEAKFTVGQRVRYIYKGGWGFVGSLGTVTWDEDAPLFDVTMDGHEAPFRMWSFELDTAPQDEKGEADD